MNKKLHCAYLFADGHAVLVFEKHDRRAGDTRWAEVVEKRLVGRSASSTYSPALVVSRRAEFKHWEDGVRLPLRVVSGVARPDLYEVRHIQMLPLRHCCDQRVVDAVLLARRGCVLCQRGEPLRQLWV